jgi:hypothetical protein
VVVEESKKEGGGGEFIRVEWDDRFLSFSLLLPPQQQQQQAIHMRKKDRIIIVSKNASGPRKATVVPKREKQSLLSEVDHRPIEVIAPQTTKKRFLARLNLAIVLSCSNSAVFSFVTFQCFADLYATSLLY